LRRFAFQHTSQFKKVTDEQDNPIEKPELQLSAAEETAGTLGVVGSAPAEPILAPASEPTAELAMAEPAVEASQPESPPQEPVDAAVSQKVPAAEEPAEEKVAAEPEKKSDKMDWYILKVQSNREESIREGLLRRVAIAGLDYFFSEVIVPVERVTEFKGGKKKVIKRKLYPGYLVVHMEINDDTWFLVRETPGIGDFTGAAGRPSPMLPHEVAKIVSKAEEKSEKAPKLKIAFKEGDRVKIKDGTFENFEGEVDSIDQTNGQVTVMINIFGRSTPVTLEYWQIEAV
jgi:transcription termination/antitermination protein NusG